MNASRVGERREKETRRKEKKVVKCQVFPFCVHLAAIVDTND
jgi:hypothetical protein